MTPDDTPNALPLTEQVAMIRQDVGHLMEAMRLMLLGRQPAPPAQTVGGFAPPSVQARPEPELPLESGLFGADLVLREAALLGSRVVLQAGQTLTLARCKIADTKFMMDGPGSATLILRKCTVVEVEIDDAIRVDTDEYSQLT